MKSSLYPATPNDLRLKCRANSKMENTRLSMESTMNKSNGKLMKILESHNSSKCLARKSKIFQASQISSVSATMKNHGTFNFSRKTQKELNQSKLASQSFQCFKAKRNSNQYGVKIEKSNSNSGSENTQATQALTRNPSIEISDKTQNLNSSKSETLISPQNRETLQGIDIPFEKSKSSQEPIELFENNLSTIRQHLDSSNEISTRYIDSEMKVSLKI